MALGETGDTQALKLSTFQVTRQSANHTGSRKGGGVWGERTGVHWSQRQGWSAGEGGAGGAARQDRQKQYPGRTSRSEEGAVGETGGHLMASRVR